MAEWGQEKIETARADAANFPRYIQTLCRCISGSMYVSAHERNYASSGVDIYTVGRSQYARA